MVKKSISAATGKARPTRHGKEMLAVAMYGKGTHFIGAAILLRQKGGYEYVVLHLLCQGIEITLKALLLFKDFNTYNPKLTGYGHHLERLAVDVLSAFGLRSLRPQLKAELQYLDSLYSKHWLRYGSPIDIFIDPTTIASDRVLRRVGAVLRLTKRELSPRITRFGAGGVVP